jgi:Glycosyl transferase family 2
MSFEGVIEDFGRETISGWASYLDHGRRTFPEVRLYFRTLGSFSPSTVIDRVDDRTGFVFRLPPEFRNILWADFLDEFDSVTATRPDIPGGGEFNIPFYKSVLASLNPDNRTGLRAPRLRDYEIGAKPNGPVAVLTIAYNERVMLPLWARYYAAEFGAENLFVIDQGSDQRYDEILPKGVNIIRVPRDMFDNWLIARQVAIMQRFLLESYDSVLYSDSDEFICAAPDVLCGKPLCDYLGSLTQAVGITTGYDLLHDIGSEAPYDPGRPLLEQRRVMRRQPTMDKPLISRLPLNWIPGFHTAVEGGTPIPGLYLLHLRWFDLDQALTKGGFYRASSWSQYDVENSLAAYQREGEGEIVERFRANSVIAADLRGATFDPAASHTVVPDWMRAAISI